MTTGEGGTRPPGQRRSRPPHGAWSTAARSGRSWSRRGVGAPWRPPPRSSAKALAREGRRVKGGRTKTTREDGKWQHADEAAEGKRHGHWPTRGRCGRVGQRRASRPWKGSGRPSRLALGTAATRVGGRGAQQFKFWAKEPIPDTESAFAKTPWTCETTKPFSHDER